MIERLLICRGSGNDPYVNLALEEALLHRVGEGELILYLWQNERTVVIGKNQNPWKECKTALLEEEGGHLARRLSGGGAVYHDLGNLNFTFLMSAADYDLPRQLSVLELACRSLGIPAERSGRNDLLAGGRKFSGNAFYSHAGKAYHHGTLMVDVDLEMVQHYLSPSRAKLAAKGVESVRSRVVNLREFVPALSIERLENALIDALVEVYDVARAICPPDEAPGARQQAAAKAFSLRGRCPSAHIGVDEVVPFELLSPNEFDLCSLTAKYASDAWLYGPKLPFTLSVEDRFPWGGVELQLQVKSGVIQAAKVYTDAMDDTVAPRLESVLTHCAYRKEALRSALASLSLPAEQEAQLLTLLEMGL